MVLLHALGARVSSSSMELPTACNLQQQQQQEQEQQGLQELLLLLPAQTYTA
jgi:hypothetical protein